MARHPRFFEPGTAQLISTSTVLKQELMPSNKTVGAILGGVLARYVDKYNITLHSFVFLPSEFRLIASAPSDDPCQLAYFMRDLKAAITYKLKALSGYSGIFFSGRYKAIPILDKESLVEQVNAMHTLALSYKTGENYIFSSIEEYSGQKRSFLWEDRSAYHKRGGERRGVARRYEEYGLSVRIVSGVIKDKNGASHIALTPTAAERECYAKDKRTRAAFMARKTVFKEKLEEGSQALRIGDVFNAVFPKNCFKPMLRANWRVRVFLDEVPQVV